MEIINKRYIKVDRLDIYGQLLEASDENNKSIEKYNNKFIKNLLNYDQGKRLKSSVIYIDKDSDYFKKNNIRFENIPITRQTIINAMFLSMINEEIDMSIKLKQFLSKDKILPNELGDLLDYVLENNVSVAEYFEGEERKLIYNEEKNELEIGYINNNENIKKLIK